MKENLNVSKYSDGTIIPQVTDPTAWANLTTGAWCYYSNSMDNGTTYGKLYNWYAVLGIWQAESNNPSPAQIADRKSLAPSGWHVPTDAEWTTLTTYLGGEINAINKLKETGTTHWNSPNTDANNSSGFTGLPGGHRTYTGSFSSIRNGGFWWRSSEADTTHAWGTWLQTISGIRVGSSKKYGFSMRCLRNSSLSTSTFETNTLKLYPNPVVSILNLITDYNLVNQPYTIIDGLGRVVMNGKLNEVNTLINVEQLSKGIYYLKVLGISASKFIKE